MYSLRALSPPLFHIEEVMTNLTAYTDGLAKNGIYWRWYGGPSSATVTSKPPLVMVMGYGGNLATWSEEFLVRLSERLTSNQGVLVFDHLGSGGSAAVDPEKELSLVDFAHHVQGLLDELKIAKANIYGYSMGGCIALEFMRARPDRVDKLVLVATTAGGKLYHKATPEVAERMQNPRGETYDEMYFDFLSISMPAEAIEKHRATLTTICDITRDPVTPLYVLQMKLRAFKNFDASDLVSSISSPTLVIHGNSDELMPTANGIELAKNIKDAQLALIDDCGHYPHIEKQDEVLKTLTAFL
jgi:3-oxoadipate enol-lactonase